MTEHRLDWRARKLYLGDTCVGDDEMDAARFMLANNLASKRDSFTTFRGDMACFKAGVSWAAARRVTVSAEGTPVFTKLGQKRQQQPQGQENGGSDDAP